MEQIDKYFENVLAIPKKEKDFSKDHSVIISFLNYPSDELDILHELDMKLDKIIQKQNVGFYDGHEIAVDGYDGTLYMYGPNAENLFKVVKPILEETKWLKGAIANLRFGKFDEDAPELEVELIVKN